jgi:broad-specificity NMP kinase
MIIWINGAFGCGKTQTAFELHRRIPNSYVYDPENAGFFIRKNLPKEIHTGDFQDYQMWREFNYSMLKHLSDQYDGTIIVPMTVVSSLYFDEIVGRLRNDGIIINHFVLSASMQTLLKRLRSRGDGKDSWAAKQMERCIEGLSNKNFEYHIDTENMTIEAVAERIASIAEITLLPQSRGRLKKIYNRVKTQLQHVRLQ